MIHLKKEDFIMTFQKMKAISILFCVVILPLLAPSIQQPDVLHITQTDRKIVIDGNLDDWKGVKEVPVNFTMEGEKITSSSDIAVTARFTFDSKNFYVAVKAIDDTFEFPNRSWRYGDGLYVTFIDSYQGNQSDRFYTFGFSKQGKELVKVLVNRDGTYFPKVSIEDVELEVILDRIQKSITYEISIPFKYILPFKPFLQSKWGINLIYVDRDQNQREILQLFPDTEYDTELSNERKGEIFKIINHSPGNPKFQTLIKASHFYHDAEKSITTAINSPFDASGWKIQYELSSASMNVSTIKDITLKKGMNLFTFNIDKKDYPSGIYDLSLGIIDAKGFLKFSENNTFFILNRDEFENGENSIVKIKEGELFLSDKVFRNSIPTLEIRFKWIREFMEKAPPFADIGLLIRWYQEMNFLLENVEKGKPALFLLGRVGRLAHRSKIDETLQPYSVYIPENYDGKKPLPLFVTLHGSGVDEENTILNVARVYLEVRIRKKVGKMIILSPKGRGLSD